MRPSSLHGRKAVVFITDCGPLSLPQLSWEGGVEEPLGPRTCLTCSGGIPICTSLLEL